MIMIGVVRSNCTLGALGAHTEFDRQYEVEAAGANYEDDDPPWPPGPRVLACLPDQHGITLHKANHICICTYVCLHIFLHIVCVHELLSVSLLCDRPMVL